MSKTSMNIQDSFLNQARKDKVELTVRLLDGSEIVGRILAFDSFTLIVQSGEGETVVYKHAIASLQSEKPVQWNLTQAPPKKDS